MERCEKPVRFNRDNPSFSSTLLDAIYRSIDETDGDTTEEQRKSGAPDSFPCRNSVKKKQHTTAVTGNAVIRRKHESGHRPLNYTSSSSECSSYGGFSSSEADSAIYSARPKPVRTGRFSPRSGSDRPVPPPPPQKKSSSIKSRFKELRKAKSPVSPGARLASFLNTLFAAKKPKVGTPPGRSGEVTTCGEESGCSSASSYSRSCLSKTPSSATANGVKRSVRFYPVSVVVGEDCRPKAAALAPPPPLTAERKKRVEDLLRGFEEEEDEEEDDDVASDSSSDLFELENLTAIESNGRYRDELPVYETTNFGKNRAIAQGLIR